MNAIPAIETQPRQKIKTFQEGKLKELLTYVAKHALFYQRHFARNKININSIQHLEDLSIIPPTTKNDLQLFNWDFLCTPKSKIAEYTSTSGTLGKPVIMALTQNDVQRLAYNEALSFACAGCRADDIFQLMVTLDRQFMAGMAYYEGIRKLGAALIRTGPGLPVIQWETIKRLKTTVLVAVPSFLVKINEYASEHGIPLNAASVKRAICIGEGFRNQDFLLNSLGKRISQDWNIRLYGTYASTEMQTAFTECEHGLGGHQHPELIIVELLDDDNQPVAEGQPGEVTVTTLGVEGMPLIRFKTGDVCQAHYNQCPCGRTTLRLGPVLGRKQQMIKLKGTTLYPPAVFDVINQVHEVADYVVEVFTNDMGLDDLRIHIATHDSVKAPAEIKIKSAFNSRIRVTPEIVFSSMEQIQKMQVSGNGRKINRLADLRKSMLNNH